MTIVTPRPKKKKRKKSDRAFVYFMSLVEQSDSGCWLWQGSVDRKDYGRMTDATLAHRWAYAHFVAPIPEGLVLDHLCRVHRCVCPLHLEPVTNRENLLRHYVLQTHCKHGHEYTADNTYISPKGHRRCRRCHVIENVARQKTEHVKTLRAAYYKAKVGA